MATTSLEKLLTWGVAEIIDRSSLIKRLSSKKKLVVKLGIDPTKPDLHLGHALPLNKLRQFQDLGHETILLVGDFTTKIGDPSGRNSARPVLTDAEIKTNLATYFEQAKLIIDPAKTKIQFNSEWLAKLSYADFIQVAMSVGVQTLLERDDFASRLKDNQPLSLHELFYPVTQGWDSVVMKADIEIGGWDQRLNMLMGRELQKKNNQPPQEVIAMKALVGLDGERKMSKSLDNYIGLTDSADQMFGKVMSIPDKVTDQYAELAAFLSPAEIIALPEHPRDRKAAVAKKIVALYHGQPAAKSAASAFDQTFRDKKVANQLAADLFFNTSSVQLLEVVTLAAEVSRSQAERLINQRAVRVAGEAIDDISHRIDLTAEGILLQVGKHIWRNLKRRV